MALLDHRGPGVGRPELGSAAKNAPLEALSAKAEAAGGTLETSSGLNAPLHRLCVSKTAI